MRISISGRHMEVTDALRLHIEKGLQKVRSHFDRVIDVDVVLSVEKHRHIAEMTLHANGIRIHSREASQDMYASLDAVSDKLEKQVRKFKDRFDRHQPRKGKEQGEYEHNIIEMTEQEANETSAPRHRVVLQEKLAMKPMSVEEAAMQLELANEKFLVFSNAETQRVNVIYPRDDGTFGLIEPQF